ncbi:MAG: hypothetical protein OXC30_03415 [Alphaproteobacteria bacterium]|nr:hypothetical protein [Alphaproteobacteria bacterium]
MTFILLFLICFYSHGAHRAWTNFSFSFPEEVKKSLRNYSANDPQDEIVESTQSALKAMCDRSGAQSHIMDPLNEYFFFNERLLYNAFESMNQYLTTHPQLEKKAKKNHKIALSHLLFSTRACIVTEEREAKKHYYFWHESWYKNFC